MSYEKKRDLVLKLTMVFSSIYLLWRLFFTLPVHEGPVQLALGILLFLAEAITTLGTFELYLSKMRSAGKQIQPMDIPPELYPDVDVLIATHNEPVDLLYKTVNACTYMDYPDKSKVHIYLCDDGNRDEVRQLAQQFSVGYLGLANNTHAKSGNYNNALANTHSPLIATFDADMIPQREFLVKTVPYFFAQEWVKEGDTYRRRRPDEQPEQRIGLVQTPQSFYNQDLFQFNLFMENDIPNEQDFFSREINVMRNASNSVAYTGSNTVILRQAMEDIGGFPYHTITEDFETSLRMQKEGYITYATTETLASGLSTTTVASMIKQRVRWAQGVIQSIQNTNAIFTKKLPRATRISYLNAFLYWWSFFSRMIFILAPIVFALFDVKLVECGFFELLLFWLPSHLLYSSASRYLSTNVRNLRWSQIIDTILCPYLIVPVFLETIGVHERKFKVTNKNKTSVKTTNFRFILPHAALILLSLAAGLRYVNGKYGMSLLYSSVILYWLLHNLVSLVYAVFFMLGRKSYRKFERLKAEETISVELQDRCLPGTTVDVSEEGMAFRLEDPVEILKDETFFIHVCTAHYHARLQARMVYRKQTEDDFVYAVQVSPLTERDRREYMQIIHDRLHTLPKELDPWRTPYDDIARNLERRKVQIHRPQRKPAALPVPAPVPAMGPESAGAATESAYAAANH